jgi:hypothetical protein
MLYAISHRLLIATGLAVAVSFAAVPRAFAVESTPTVDSKCQINSNITNSNARAIQDNTLKPKVDLIQLRVNEIGVEKDTKNNVVNISRDDKAQKINEALCALRDLFSN